MMDEFNDSFVIDNDNKADWAIRIIRDNELERDRLIKIAKDQIDDLTNQIECISKKYENKSNYLKSLLNQYFKEVPHKVTKTQESYKLLTGSLVYKKPSVKINHDDEKLLEYLKGSEFVKVKKSIDWAEFKKELKIVDDRVVDVATGEVVEACTIEEVPASFDVKLNKEGNTNGMEL